MVPLMEAALDRARTLAPEDPVAAGLVGYLEHHIPEEMHGDSPAASCSRTWRCSASTRTRCARARCRRRSLR